MTTPYEQASHLIKIPINDEKEFKKCSEKYIG